MRVARFNHLNCDLINSDSANDDLINFDFTNCDSITLAKLQKTHLQNTQNATQNPFSFNASCNAFWWCDCAPRF